MRRSSYHSVDEYVLLSSIWNTSNSSIAAASRARLFRPLPPSPTRRECPPGRLMIRHTRDVCSRAYRKSTSGSGFLEMAL